MRKILLGILLMVAMFCCFVYSIETHAAENPINESFKNSFKVEMWGAKGKASGSAFAIKGLDGYLITNRHVVKGFDIIRVIAVDGKKYLMTVELISDVSDLAILKFGADKPKLSGLENL